jgi:hypothetical protein
MHECRYELLGRVVLLANRWSRYHVAAYLLGNGLLWAVNRLTSDVWWAFWPLFVWSLLLASHFFLIRGFRADDAWADKRAERLLGRAYDSDHIRRIERSYRDHSMPGAHDLNPPDEPREPSGR